MNIIKCIMSHVAKKKCFFGRQLIAAKLTMLMIRNGELGEEKFMEIVNVNSSRRKFYNNHV